MVGVNVHEGGHGVLVAADHGSRGCGQRKEPHGVERFHVQGTCPDGFLVEQDTFWGSEEGDWVRFWRQRRAGNCVLRGGRIWKGGRFLSDGGGYRRGSRPPRPSTSTTLGQQGGS